ncbi:hypothetical protein H9L19_03575 [Weissella diestrammenae]|uniref:Uncharacterized protein n=1 Tax=Weissella diestrammenae TaxID=1162633 RepID=A0A7G9T772_9LACO|nr:hypothetical protein [Weissella diestrammenae]MCM0582451.1 hypothetical protein [Weissella diestrammenae]QNN75947.1 hypothetical protein H9L19_03575 [Weissella diestrammenae]
MQIKNTLSFWIRMLLILTSISILGFTINGYIHAKTINTKNGSKTIVRPSAEYPLGAATSATFYAGGEMVFDPNTTTDIKGQFYAGEYRFGFDFNTEDYPYTPSTKIQNFSKDTTSQLPDHFDPSLISAKRFSNSFIRVLSKQDSMVGTDNQPLHYVMGDNADNNSISDTELSSILNQQQDAINNFKQKDYTINNQSATLGDIDYFKKNNVKTAQDAVNNVIHVSDYYASLTATTYNNDGEINGYRESAFNSAIKSITTNTTEIKATNDNYANTPAIQINVDMNQTDKQGIAAINIDGHANNQLYQNAQAIVINLLNFDQTKQKVPYFILNYHNFSSFNFGQSAWLSVNGYTTEQVKSAQKAPEANQFFPSTTSGDADHSLFSQRYDLSNSQNTKLKYHTASHILHNFSTLAGDDAAENTNSITLNANSGTSNGYAFIGTILAPNTSVIIKGDAEESFVGNVITAENLLLSLNGLNMNTDKSFGASFNQDGDFPGTSEIEDTTDVPQITSIGLPDNVNFAPENTSTNYSFQYSLNNNDAIDPPSTTMHVLDGRKFSNTLRIEQPANSTNVIWAKMNNTTWKKYTVNGKNPLAPNKTDTAQSTSLTIDDVTEDLKTNDIATDYDDKTVYAGENINGTYQIDNQDRQFIGQHLSHINQIAFVVASESDNLSKMSDAEIKAKYANTITKYTLNVHGDILVNYPKTFDFGIYKLGSGNKDSKHLATGMLYVENPFYQNWRLDVTNNTSKDQSAFNPLLLEKSTVFSMQQYVLDSNTDDSWTPSNLVNLGYLTNAAEHGTYLLTLDTKTSSGLSNHWQDVQPSKDDQFYKSTILLDFNPTYSDGYVKRTGTFTFDAKWTLNIPDRTTPLNKIKIK